MIRPLLLVGILFAGHITAGAQQEPLPPMRTLNLQQAVDLALQHNHAVRIASLHVEESARAKDVARSAYLPVLRNDSIFAHLTDTQLIAIPAGSLGSAGGSALPTHPVVIQQGERTFETSGTGLVQPLTQLFKIKSANDVASGELDAARAKAQSTKDQVALKVRQLYYRVLIVQSQEQAIESKIRAVEDLKAERVQQVRYGSTLEADLIESKAQSLQAKQDLLTAELQLSDLRMQFNDLVGLPLNSEVVLDPDVLEPTAAPLREECVNLAFHSNPDISEAKASLEKALAGVREAKREYIPDLEAFARYSYQNDVPFLARNFGTFGVHFSYDIFDGGKKRAVLRERSAQAAQASENLARVRDEVEVRVTTAYNKLDRTAQMVAVSQELMAARKEATRVSEQGLERGTAMPSQADAAAAQESEARTLLLKSQLEYAQAKDELNEAIGGSATQ